MIMLVVVIAVIVAFWAALIWASCFSSTGIIRTIGLVVATICGFASLVG
jgi:hypothetical protein